MRKININLYIKKLKTYDNSNIKKAVNNYKNNKNQ
jgi:hypothetical protein